MNNAIRRNLNGTYNISVDESIKKQRNIVSRLDIEAWRSSTKIEALLEELSRLRQRVPMMILLCMYSLSTHTGELAQVDCFLSVYQIS